MGKIKFSKKAIWIQIFFGLVCGLGTSPFIIKNLYSSDFVGWCHVLLTIWISIFCIRESIKKEFYEAVEKGELTINKNFLSIFLGVTLTIELILFSVTKFILNEKNDVFHDFTVRSIVFFLSVIGYSLIVSYRVNHKSFSE